MVFWIVRAASAEAAQDIVGLVRATANMRVMKREGLDVYYSTKEEHFASSLSLFRAITRRKLGVYL